MKSLRPQEQHHEQLYKVFPICKSLSISVLVVEKCILWQLDYLEKRPGKNLPSITKKLKTKVDGFAMSKALVDITANFFKKMWFERQKIWLCKIKFID